MNQVDWRFFDLVAQLVGDKEFSGEYASVKDVNDRVHFGEDATLLLIYEYSERKGLFSKAARDHPLWEEIAAKIHDVFPSMGVTVASCQRKWESLKSLYFDFRHTLQETGQDSAVLSWPLYEPMHNVLGPSVAEDPLCTFSAGSSKAVKSLHGKKCTAKKRAMSSEEEEEQKSKKKKKKSKKSKKESVAAKKLALEEKKVKARAKFL
ncbi:WD repeat-containing protein 81 [Frankliniella fusca]|uniref:WD repeat-containing protein 81 n=1 Tax=Frankliniella fusca TaxID=407009 RepID=A0AAE1I1E3_9NEOP|nr:WD repeat-containing protein 81 [Frankliniella fusca]